MKSMKYNLIFAGFYEEKHENTEEVLQTFLAEQLEIKFNIDFTSVLLINCSQFHLWARSSLYAQQTESKTISN